MNFIARHINVVGLLLLTAFAAAAAALYLDLPAKVAKTPSPAAINYSCPMHPEVVSPHPGACPKCGMALTQPVPGKSSGCGDSMTGVANDSSATANHAGCAHPAGGGGGCCPPKPPAASDSLPPGGCTRSLYPQPEPVSH